ncbi:MAG: hypothetical protein K2Q24_05135 [Chitinophagaceae bacterium]|jgi:hypothetical protein|nr:hypothetical protein [Chitinophagaceae bacterium]
MHSKSPLSFIALALSVSMILYAGVAYYPKWKQGGSEATLSWDVLGYYMYLPAVFIYGDIKKCGFKDSILAKYQPTPDFQQAFVHSNGNYVMKYSSGQAVMMAPFFFAGHLAAGIGNKYLKDGFSFPYQLAIGIGMLLYAFAGIFLLRKILLFYFNDAVTAISLFTIVFASNYLNYAAIDGAMTHNSLFTLYCLLIYTSIKFYQQPSFLKAVTLGALTGMVTLIRPTEVIAILIPLLWGVGNYTELKDRLRFFIRKLNYSFVFAVAFVAVVSVQLLYWKYSSGNWLVYSYQDQTFSWLNPHVWQGFFSFKSGWLIYSPVMILSLAGFVFLYKHNKQLFLPVFIFSVLFIYICFSWDIWWYGGSLGIRAMVQAYPLLAFALAAIIHAIQKSNFSKSLIYSFIALCVMYNLWLTHQAHKGGLYKASEMTGPYLKAILFKNEIRPEVYLCLDNPEQLINLPVAATHVYANNFNTETDEHASINYAVEGKSLFLNREKQFTPEYSFTVPAGGKTLHVAATFRTERKEWDVWRMTQMIVKFYDQDSIVKTTIIRVFRAIGDNETKQLHLNAKLPGKFSRVTVGWWNAGSDKPILIDDLQVSLLE